MAELVRMRFGHLNGLGLGFQLSARPSSFFSLQDLYTSRNKQPLKPITPFACSGVELSLARPKVKSLAVVWCRIKSFNDEGRNLGKYIFTADYLSSINGGNLTQGGIVSGFSLNSSTGALSGLQNGPFIVTTTLPSCVAISTTGSIPPPGSP